jgi:hypothetical protein
VLEVSKIGYDWVLFYVSLLLFFRKKVAKKIAEAKGRPASRPVSQWLLQGQRAALDVWG